MGRACGPYEGEYSCTQGFGETDHMNTYAYMGGRIILKWIFKKQMGRGVSEHRDKGWVLENAVMNLQI